MGRGRIWPARTLTGKEAVEVRRRWGQARRIPAHLDAGGQRERELHKVARHAVARDEAEGAERVDAQRPLLLRHEGNALHVGRLAVKGGERSSHHRDAGHDRVPR